MRLFAYIKWLTVHVRNVLSCFLNVAYLFLFYVLSNSYLQYTVMIMIMIVVRQ